MSCDDAFVGLCEAFWRLSDAIDAKVRAETDSLPDFLAAQVAADVRRECYPEEKALWEAAYVRVMSALARADLAAGYEPFTPFSERSQKVEQGVLF